MSSTSSNRAFRSEAEFQKLSQTIATSIQKILQNGKQYTHEMPKIHSTMKYCQFFTVSTMQRMVNQIGTAQDSPDHKQQL